MDPALGLLIAVVAAPVTYLVAWVTARERAAVFRRAAESAGLSSPEVRTVLGIDGALVADASGLPVRLERVRPRGGADRIRIAVGGLGHGPYGLTVRPEGAGTAFEKVFDGGEIETGDGAFDRAAYVQGEQALARAVLGVEARRELAELFAGRLVVRAPDGREGRLEVSALVAGDELRVEIASDPGGAGPLGAALAAVVEVARRLVAPKEVAERIAANCAAEPTAAVRLENLRTLLKEFPGAGPTREATLGASRDADPAVRLEAALSLGEEGIGLLRALATGGEVPEEAAARAVVALGERLEASEALALLSGALDSGKPLLARAALRAAAREEATEAGEALLLRALAHEDETLRVAAAEALGRAASPRAVVPLRESASAHPFDAALRRAARQAIAAIQARVEGGAPGQLSLAGDEAGRLSLATEDVAGRLSLGPGTGPVGAAGSPGATKPPGVPEPGGCPPRPAPGGDRPSTAPGRPCPP